ncbi:GNAT family N-acetyltransferase [Halomicrobium sp. HM KBTZ05]|uniref:GNAT family N-acetyltransferase n=1 Tax=Halomicrobium mukohataei TaxID=57705 RepID=A0A847U4X1_9EURY|nr:GNAT family N-acetyltransferase [Halomicrobium mukohataei]NLV10733.1 GNAT family N-acetyltransferase [Halomicrobium mukohataei]
MSDPTVTVLSGDADLEPAFDVRRDVFVDEQGVDEAIEIDGKDPDATHVLAEVDGVPVATARLRVIDDGVGKVERVAVRGPHRESGVGRQVMHRIEQLAIDDGLDRLELHSQTRVEGFYERLGYETVSDEFDEAGIPHVEMRKDL